MNILLGKPFGDSKNDPLEEHIEFLSGGLRRGGCNVQVVPFQALDQVQDAHPGITHPALVHVFHAVKGGFSGLRFAKENRLPLVLSLVGTDVGVDLFNPVIKDRLKTLLTQTDAIVAPYPGLANELKTLLPTTKPITIIPPGFPPIPADLPNKRAMAGFSRDRKLVVSVGSFSPVGNVSFLYPVMERLQENNSEFEFVIVGDPTTEAVGKRVTNLCRNNPHFHFVPGQTFQDVMAWIKAADVVLDVAHVIDFPNLTQLAAALGTPLVVPDIPGWRAVSQDENSHPGKGTAFFYDTVSRPDDFRRIHDSEDCAQAILGIFKNPHAAREVVNRSLSRLRKTEKPDLEVFLYLRLYRNLLRM